MFSGIVEAQTTVLAVIPRDEVLEVHLACPPEIKDLKIGDSLAIDGVCLTIEAVDTDEIQVALGAETLRITGWDSHNLIGREVNLERSMRLGDRLHGHIVTGHVDGVGRIVVVEKVGENVRLKIEVSSTIIKYLWSKGSVAINGVSLTLNQVGERDFEVGLIPETLRRTNLAQVRPGDQVNIEVDSMARGLIRTLELRSGKSEIEV